MPTRGSDSAIKLVVDAVDDRGDEGGREVPGAQALRRGLSLLDLVAAEPGLRFSDLWARSGLTKATAHRMLSTLVEAGYLRVDERGQRYHLGFRLFEMAHLVWDQFDLRSAAEPELERLRDLTDEAVRLAILDGQDVLYVDQREAAQIVRLGSGVGARASIYASGAGKAILAHLEPLKRQQLLTGLALSQFTPSTITNRRDLDQHLDLTKARGYAVSFEEQRDGVSSVAAAILDHRARALGAVAIVGPSYRLGLERLHELGRDVMEAARRISGNAGQVAMSITTNPRPLGPSGSDVTCVIPTTSFLGEGPTWLPDQARLLLVDILAPAVLMADPADGSFTSYPMPELLSAIVPRRAGGLLAALQTGLKAVDLTTGAITPIAAPEAAKPGNRFNDGKCDRLGRFWVGTMALDATPGHGSLYRLDPDARCTLMDDGFTVSNGLGWSPDDRWFYFTDSAARAIYRYPFDLATGTLGPREAWVQVPEGSGVPDGLAVDAQGYVWSAHWDGWCVTRYDPAGAVDRVITLPVPRPTSCTFGGPDHSTLYVTSARIRLSAQQLADAPLSGGVFAIPAPVPGLPSHAFAG